MKTPILFTAILVGAFAVAIFQAKSSKSGAREESLITTSPEQERPSILSGTSRGKQAELVLCADQALLAIERLLSQPNHSKTGKAIEKAILSALRGMKKSDRGPFLRGATELIAQSDFPDRNRLLESLTQKWAENDVDGVTAWAATAEEEIAGMALPLVGMTMARWKPEEAAAWVARQEDYQQQSQTAHSGEAVIEDTTAAWPSHLENVPDPASEAGIDQILPPTMAIQVMAARAWDHTSLGDSIRE